MTGRQRTAFATLACLVLTASLSLVAAGDNVLPGDVGLARAVQDLDFTGIDRLERLGYFLGSPLGIYSVGLPLIALLALARDLPGILLVIVALALRSTNPWIKELIESPRPTPDLVRVAGNATGDPGSYGFPSGHVMGTVLLYGAILYLADVHIQRPRLRRAIQAVAGLAILITALSRIYSGAHWPSDVLGGLLWGGLLLFAIYLIRWGYRAVRGATAQNCNVAQP